MRVRFRSGTAMTRMACHYAANTLHAAVHSTAAFSYMPRNRLMNGWLTFNTSGRCFSRS